MHFELKNAKATYQRLANKVLKNDIITKSSSILDHVYHLTQAFKQLKKYLMKFNPEKCYFKVTQENIWPAWSVKEELK